MVPANPTLLRRGAIGALLLLSAAPAQAASGGLEIFPDWRGLVLFVLFALLIWPANKLVFAPLVRALDERRERIQGARARADEISKEATAVLGRYEDAIAAVGDEAETGRRDQLDAARREQLQAATQARGEAETQIAAARGEVARALVDARAQLRAQAEPLAREAASQVLGRPL